MTEPAAPRAVRRRSSTRATLIAAAEAIFQETGSTSVSVEAVVARAGFTRGAFYSNFRTVDELFFAVYEQQAEAVFAVLEHELGAALDGHPTVDGVVQGVVHGLPPEDRWYAIRSVLTTRARHDPEVNALLRAHTDRFHATLQPLLVAALDGPAGSPPSTRRSTRARWWQPTSGRSARACCSTGRTRCGSRRSRGASSGSRARPERRPGRGTIAG